MSEYREWVYRCDYCNGPTKANVDDARGACTCPFASKKQLWKYARDSGWIKYKGFHFCGYKCLERHRRFGSVAEGTGR